MKKSSTKKGILIIMILVIAMLTVSTNVYAIGQLVANPPNQQTDGNQTDGNQTVSPSLPTTSGGTNTEGSNYQNSTLPQTGDASDYAVFTLIVVSVIVAGYAYKKVRDYNI